MRVKIMYINPKMAKKKEPTVVGWDDDWGVMDEKAHSQLFNIHEGFLARTFTVTASANSSSPRSTRLGTTTSSRGG